MGASIGLVDPSAARRRWTWARLVCAVWGHHADNRRLNAASGVQRCACGDPLLADDGHVTHIRHVLSCFLGHHTYMRTGTRAGHNEYMCHDCGHPLLFRCENDPYESARPFAKRVRYLCSVFGHAVHTVDARAGLTEYACGCGHSFLREARHMARIFHPLACFFRGHFVTFLERRDGFAEFRCRVCGHPFGFGRIGRP